MSKHKGLYRPKGSSIWWMDFQCRGCRLHPEGGGRHRQSTKKKTLSEAQLELDKERGTKFLSDKKITVEIILQSVISDYRNKGRKSLDNTERRIKKHLVPFLGAQVASKLTSADIRAFIESRLNDKDKPASNAEINRELAVLRRAYVLAVKDKVLDSRPHFEMLPERNQRRGFFTYAEVISLCEHLPPDMADAVLFLWETGWRIMEALTREWKDIDFGEEVIRLDSDDSKNEQSRVFPFTATLREMLKRRKATNPGLNPYVFHIDGLPIYIGRCPSDFFRREWRRACKEAKLVGRVPHDLRRSAARTMITAGVDEQTAMDLLGHKTASIFRRYRIVTESERLDAVRKLDAAKLKKNVKKTSK